MKVENDTLQIIDVLCSRQVPKEINGIRTKYYVQKREIVENIHEVTIEIFAEDIKNECIRVGRAYPDSVIDYKRMEKDIESLLALYIRNVIDYFDGKVVETRTFNISEIKE